MGAETGMLAMKPITDARGATAGRNSDKCAHRNRQCPAAGQAGCRGEKGDAGNVWQAPGRQSAKPATAHSAEGARPAPPRQIIAKALPNPERLDGAEAVAAPRIGQKPASANIAAEKAARRPVPESARAGTSFLAADRARPNRDSRLNRGHHDSADDAGQPEPWRRRSSQPGRAILRPCRATA